MALRFRKSFHRSLDAKGRLMLPPEYRDVIFSASETGGFVLTGSGYYDCIVAYTMPKWVEVEKTLEELQSSGLALSKISRRVLGRSEELACDPQGRVRISQSLMRLARLGKEVVLVPLGDTFEIWDEQIYDDLKPDKEDLDLVMQDLARRGIKL
jgi:MraZ protein